MKGSQAVIKGTSDVVTIVSDPIYITSPVPFWQVIVLFASGSMKPVLLDNLEVQQTPVVKPWLGRQVVCKRGSDHIGTIVTEPFAYMDSIVCVVAWGEEKSCHNERISMLYLID